VEYTTSPSYAAGARSAGRQCRWNCRRRRAAGSAHPGRDPQWQQFRARQDDRVPRRLDGAVGGPVVARHDGNGVAEVAVLAARRSDDRGVVEIRNVSGPQAVRQIWFAAGQTPLAFAAIDDDADNNGMAEIAVCRRETAMAVDLWK